MELAISKLLAVALIIASAASAESEQDRSWNNLSHTFKQEVYTVATRDGRCITGHIDSFDKGSITLDSSRLDRKDVVRVGDDASVADRDSIYSGRSSWSDLAHAEPNKYEHIRLELKDRTPRNCRTFVATDEQITCDEKVIERPDVALGFYVRLGPATQWEHHVMRENVPFLAPRTWFNLAFYPRITVLLYDASLPDENFKIECRRRAR